MLKRYKELKPTFLFREVDRKSKDEKAKSKASEGKTPGAKRSYDEGALDRRIDGLFSQICRLKDSECRVCSGVAIHCHHAAGRGWANKWNRKAHIPLCKDCHDWVTDKADGKAWNARLLGKLGINKHATGTEPTLAEKKAKQKALRVELKQLKAAA